MKKVASIIILIFLMTLFFSTNAFAAEPPRLLLQKVSTNPDTINPGEKFRMNFTVKNIAKTDAKNAVIKLVSLEGKNTLGDFSPVGGSSEVYCGTIKKNSSKDAAINLIANTVVKSGAYNVVVALSYTDSRNKPFSSQQVVGVIVKNKPVLKITALDYPSAISKGEKVPLKMSIINAGKGNLDEVTISLDNLPGADKTKYIGTLEPEDSDDFETELNVDGDIKGTIEVSYLDEFNVESKITQDVSVKVNASEVNTTKKSEGGFFSSLGSFFKKLFGLGD